MLLQKLLWWILESSFIQDIYQTIKTHKFNIRLKNIVICSWIVPATGRFVCLFLCVQVVLLKSHAGNNAVICDILVVSHIIMSKRFCPPNDFLIEFKDLYFSYKFFYLTLMRGTITSSSESETKLIDNSLKPILLLNRRFIQIIYDHTKADTH